MLLVDHAVSLGYTLMIHPSSPILSTLPSILHLILAAYLIALTSLGLTASTVDEHWPIVVHIASLSLLSTLAQCISVLVPNDGTVQISNTSYYPSLFGPKMVSQLYRRDGQSEEEEDTYSFWHASVLLSAIVTLIAATMPLGPQLYFPPERVYTLKSIETAAKERGEDPAATAEQPKKRTANVTGLVASSSFGILLFDYSTKVVMLGFTSISLEIADLPILPANLRATSIFSNMRRRLYALKQAQPPKRAASPSKWAAYEITVGVPFASALARTFPALERRFPSITETRTIAPFRAFFRLGDLPPWTKLLVQLAKANRNVLLAEMALAFCCALMFYTPAFFLRKFITWLENDPRRVGREGTSGILSWLTVPGSIIDGVPVEREGNGWAWVYCAGIFGTTAIMYCESTPCSSICVIGLTTSCSTVISGQLWSISTTVVQLRLKTQLNTTLFAKTLVRKNIASTAADNKDKEKEKEKDGNKKKDAKPGGTTNRSEQDTLSGTIATGPHSAVGTNPTHAATTSTAVNTNGEPNTTPAAEKGKDKAEEEFSSKAQVMTLMTTDVDRVADMSWHLFTIVDCPIEIVIGSYFLYSLLGISAFYGLASSFRVYFSLSLFFSSSFLLSADVVADASRSLPAHQSLGKQSW